MGRRRLPQLAVFDIRSWYGFRICFGAKLFSLATGLRLDPTTAEGIGKFGMGLPNSFDFRNVKRVERNGVGRRENRASTLI